VVAFVARARPEALPAAPAAGVSTLPRPVLLGLAVAAVVLGGVGSWFASSHPDGLEWSIFRVSGREELAGAEAPAHRELADLQRKTAFLPGYGFKADAPEAAPGGSAAAGPEPWPAVRAGTSVAGLVGGLLSLALACLVGLALKARAAPCKPGKP